MSSARHWLGTGITLGIMAFSGSACRKSKPREADRTALAPSAQSDSRAGASTPGGKAACPATGQWAECSAFAALDRAGLAPRRDSATGPVSLNPLTKTGTRILLGGAEIDLFIYPSETERAHDEARLDKRAFIEASDEPTLRGEPTLIRNANLLAILHSRNDHQRERVSDALSAGPPQPSAGAVLPGSRAR